MQVNLSGLDVHEWLGVRYRTILPPERTGGAMSIVDSLYPAGSEPPRHIHEHEDEVFIIQNGECELWLKGETFRKGTGQAVFIPRGRDHTFRVVGDTPCRHFLVLTPGGFEGFFADIARGRFRIPEDMEQIGPLAARYNLRFTGPPL